MQKVFERIGIGSKDEFGHVYEEWFITDYECPIYGFQKLLGEYESLDKLNYLASRIDEMDKWDQEKFVAIMEAGCDEVSDIDDLINLTYNLDCYDFLPDVTDEEDLGRYYIEEAGIYDTKAMGNLANYIDFERFGRDVAMDEGGRFTDDGYIRNTGDGWTRMFDGSLDDIPDEYRLTGGGEEPMKDGNILAVVVEPGKKPEIKEIDSSLKGLQALVGGYIQAIYPYEDPVGIVCNEEAKLEGQPLNRALRDEDGDIYDIVAGTFAIVGLTDDSFGSLDSELALKYAKLFIRFDDPSIEPRIIEAKDDIDLIICSLTELTYKKIKSNSPAPLGNTYFELNYSDGSKLELGAVYVKGLHGDLYQAESMEFAALLDSYRK